ncbi:MAG: flagellar biosynthetic protein FliR [Pontiellaceae bacterium]|nr:flagellar biosynthetic protein FliR [Pontiellaceae bacterium]MBN2784096.1 flagellar biosynthetic protein FliR [Pontiellaceae bacterium]
MQMHLPILPIAMLLVLFRFGSLVGMTAIFGRQLIPVRIRLTIALALTWFTVVHLPPEWMAYCAGIDNLIALVVAALGEVLLGAAIGLVCDLFFAILNMAGALISRGSSLMMARMLDPTSNEQSEIITLLFTMLFSLLILLWDGHLFLIKMTVESFRVLPPGFFWFREELLEMVVVLGSDVFRWGVRYSLPVMMGGLLVSVSMGLMARIAPEFNVLFLSLPFRLGVGIGLLTLFLMYGYDPMFRLFETMMMHLKYILAGAV